jgi:hypothetical protein
MPKEARCLKHTMALDDCTHTSCTRSSAAFVQITATTRSAFPHAHTAYTQFEGRGIICCTCNNFGCGNLQINCLPLTAHHHIHTMHVKTLQQQMVQCQHTPLYIMPHQERSPLQLISKPTVVTAPVRPTLNTSTLPRHPLLRAASHNDLCR